MKSRFLMLVVMIVGLAACSEVPYTNLNNDELQMLIDKGVPVYDIRRPDEWRQTGVVKGSRKLTFVNSSGRVEPDFLMRFTQQVGKDDPVILICRTGNRTNALARHLVEQLNYTQIYNVRNGITEWVRDGRQVIK